MRRQKCSLTCGGHAKWVYEYEHDGRVEGVRKCVAIAVDGQIRAVQACAVGQRLETRSQHAEDLWTGCQSKRDANGTARLRTLDDAAGSTRNESNRAAKVC